MARGRTDDAPTGKIANLRMIWNYAIRYKWTIAGAAVALLVAALATLAIPDGFRRVIDRGFAAGGGNVTHQFNYLFAMVIVLALATALRFYFVSMLGEKVIADIRSAVHDNLLRLEPRFFEENRPSEIASRVTSDTAVIEMVVGSTVSVALRNIVLGIGGIIYLFALAPRLAAWMLVGIPLVVVPLDRDRATGADDLADQPGPDRRSGLDRRRNAGRDEDRPGLRPGKTAKAAASATPC